MNRYLPDEEMKVYLSADVATNTDGTAAGMQTSEFLNTCNPPGLPPHHLALKVGAPAIILRNLSGRLGLANGTRVIIKALYANVLDVEVATGGNQGRRVLLPRITLKLTPEESGLPFDFARRQFPLRPAYAMTINKAQGQTLQASTCRARSSRTASCTSRSLASPGRAASSCSSATRSGRRRPRSRPSSPRPARPRPRLATRAAPRLRTHTDNVVFREVLS